MAAALNGALGTSTNPQATLEAFERSLGVSETIRFRRLGADLGVHPADVQTPLGTVPDWFVRLLAIPEFKAAFPVTIEGKQVGDIVFAPDLSADVMAIASEAYIYGAIDYDDIFSDSLRHRTEFCAQVVIRRDPAMPERVDWTFSPSVFHNATDDDCARPAEPW